MRTILVLGTMLALAGCNRSEPAAGPDKGSNVSIAIARGDAGADDKSRVKIDLPGGIKADLEVPGALADSGEFDIEGVGLYPGARVTTVNVRALTGRKDTATVELGFTAPADAAAVADWYETRFAEKNVTVARAGETITGKTRDGKDFTLAMTPADTGTRGLLTIRDA